MRLLPTLFLFPAAGVVADRQALLPLHSKQSPVLRCFRCDPAVWWPLPESFAVGVQIPQREHLDRKQLGGGRGGGLPHLHHQRTAYMVRAAHQLLDQGATEFCSREAV